MKLTGVFAVVLAMGLAGCESSGPLSYASAYIPAGCAGKRMIGQAPPGHVRLNDPGAMFSAADLSSGLAEAVVAAGVSVDEVGAHINQAGGGWPRSLRSQDSRQFNMNIICSYNLVEITRLSFYDQPVVLVRVPAATNQHVPGGWKQAEDFYMVLGAQAVPAS
jgi:hypothetical protein